MTEKFSDFEDTVFTGYNVDTLKKAKIEPKTEQYIKALSRENKSLVIDKDTIKPLGMNVIVRAKVSTSNLYLPSKDHKITGQIIYTELFKVPLKVQDEYGLRPGQLCRVNTQLALQLAQGSCLEEKEDGFEWIYFKTDVGLIQYTYEYKVPEDVRPEPITEPIAA